MLLSHPDRVRQGIEASNEQKATKAVAVKQEDQDLAPKAPTTTQVTQAPQVRTEVPENPVRKEIVKAKLQDALEIVKDDDGNVTSVSWTSKDGTVTHLQDGDDLLNLDQHERNRLFNRLQQCVDAEKGEAAL